MADWFQVILLALIQGLSEFLPVSSSAHLVLPAQVFGWVDQGLRFDVAVHMGTLIAVAAYFWRDLLSLLGDVYPPARSLGGQPGELWRLAVATLPAVTAGILFSDAIEANLRGIPVIAATTIIFGLLLAVAAWKGARQSPSAEEHVSWVHALMIGCAQAIALIPGVSRSGVTITAAVLLGYSAKTAARFSFLMSVPIILGAMLFMSIDLLSDVDSPVSPLQVLVAMLVSGLSAYTTIALFLRLLDRIGLMPFVWYRMALGLSLIVIIVTQGA